MTTNPNRREVALNFPGGTLTAKLGVLTAVFGPDLQGAGQQSTTVPVSVSGHSRVRVIGGASTAVAAHTYNRKKYPSGGQGGAAGGEPIALLIDGRPWTARLDGSHQALNTFLESATLATDGPLFWKSEKGTPYGPFVGATPALPGA